MRIDPIYHVGAIVREVRSCEYEGKPARMVVAARHYRADVEEVWNALTNAERIPRWFLPIEGDLRVGGNFQFKGNAGGDIIRCEPPRRVTVTWGMGLGPSSLVDVTLSAADAGRTLLLLEHTAQVDDHFWDQFGPGAVGVGWDLAMVGLDQHLETGGTVDHQEAEAWSVSAEGKEFTRLSSDAWADASERFGTPPAQARAAAQRTAAFYAGEPVGE